MRSHGLRACARRHSKGWGVARMSDPSMIKEIQAAVTIPVVAKARIVYFVECQILQSIGVDLVAFLAAVRGRLHDAEESFSTGVSKTGRSSG
jgi:pyridoxal biosynthesis lyase PdxS